MPEAKLFNVDYLQIPCLYALISLKYPTSDLQAPYRRPPLAVHQQKRSFLLAVVCVGRSSIVH